MNEGQIGCCANVSLGFGTPQMQYFLASLQDHYRPRKPILVCEPHSEVIPDHHRDLERLSFHRVVSPNWKAPYWYLDRGAGESEYHETLARWISVHQPEMLILTGFNQFEPLLKSRHLPKHLLYYAFEAYEKREMTMDSLRCHDALKDRISLILFPEANRIKFYNKEFGYQAIPKVLVYNVPPRSRDAVCAASERNGRILMQGTIQWGLTYPEYLLNTQKPDISIDVYGPIYGSEAQILHREDVSRLFGFRYFGYVSNIELARIRGNYSYVLVMWNPVNLNSRNACPNKLFEAIASGVPPICAPHPQCVEILRKYDCGILMRDWSFNSFCIALEEARKLRGTARYRELVQNCIRAHRQELNWNAQFEKIAEALPEMSSTIRRTERFVLVDPDLVDDSKKSFGHGIHVLTAAHRRGLQPVAMVNRILRSRLPDFITTHPVFWHNTLGRNTTYPDLPREMDAPSRFVLCLKDALESEKLRPNDNVYLPSAPADFLLAIAGWQTAEHRTLPIHWHIALDDREDQEKLVRALRQMETAVTHRRLRVYCKSHALAQEIAAAAGLAVHVLPLPVLSTSPSRRRSEMPRQDLLISYLGNATREKGFPQTSLVLERLISQMKDVNVRFAIKCHSPGSAPDLSEEIHRLQMLSAHSGKIDLLPEPLAHDAYIKLLRRSDIVLNSYDPAAYRKRPSSVFVEALCADKVVLVPRGSWMASQLPAPCLWVYSSPAEIPAILKKVISDLPKHRDLARRLGVEWRGQHTGANLVRTLLES